MKTPSYILLSLVLLVCSCQSQTPDGVLSSDDMEDVLYDYHLAQGMAISEGGSTAFNSEKLADAVFQKHGITKADFDSSMVWYTTHTAELNKIYKSLSERMEKETGGVATEEGFAGDTTNIWKGNRFAMLYGAESGRSLSFKIKADTAFKQHDMFMLRFVTHFVTREIVHDAQCAIAIHYKDGDVQSSTQRIGSDGLYSLTVHQDSAKTVDFISGFIYLNGDSERKNMLLVDYIKLIRMHAVGAAQNVQSLNEQPASSNVQPQFEEVRPSLDEVAQTPRFHETSIPDAPHMHGEAGGLRSVVTPDTASFSKDRPEAINPGRVSPQQKREQRYGLTRQRRDTAVVKK